MLNPHLISWDEHNNWWESIKDDNQKTILILSKQKADVAVINFFSKNDATYWGFYLTHDSPVAVWETLIQVEKFTLRFSKYILKLDVLYCETLQSNEIVWSLHKRVGFKTMSLEIENNTIVQKFEFNESTIPI